MTADEPARVYGCRACSHELFDASTRFEFGTGAWPNFTEPMDEQAVVIEGHVPDERGYEVRCGGCAVYLGRLFSDGPEPSAERYCIEWAAVLMTRANPSR